MLDHPKGVDQYSLKILRYVTIGKGLLPPRSIPSFFLDGKCEPEKSYPIREGVWILREKYQIPTFHPRPATTPARVKAPKEPWEMTSLRNDQPIVTRGTYNLHVYRLQPIFWGLQLLWFWGLKVDDFI